jgi:diguanylate cyclase (GGDEF)-like protein/PAS domain S-box-containing protein
MNISRKMSMVVTICVLFVSLLTLWSYYYHSKTELLQSTLSHLQSNTRDRYEHYQLIVNQANTDLTILSQRLNSELSHTDQRSSFTFDQRVTRFSDGVWRNRRDSFDGTIQAGIFLPSDIQLTDKMKGFYSRALTIFDDFGAAVSSNPIFDNVWMLGHDRTEVIFDPTSPNFVYLMAGDTDYTNTPWMVLASPEVNPERTIRWTPALFDPVSKSWMTSAIFPLDIDGKWQATLGIDLRLASIDTIFKTYHSDYKSEQHFVIDDKGGFIVAGPWQQELEKGNESFTVQESDKELKQLFNQPLRDGVDYYGAVNLLGKEYQVVAHYIEPMGWKYFRIISTEEILQPLRDKAIRSLFFILFMAALLGVLINMAVSKLMVKPLVLMTERARAYALGSTPSKLTFSSNDEVAELNDAFQLMQNTLTTDAQQLLSSERRYRQVITSINEVLFQVDADCRWQFLSPVWKKLSGFELQHSLYADMVTFFHPVDRDLIGQMVDFLFEEKQTSWNGEVRLRRQDGRYIWVNLSLKLSKAREGEFSGALVSGTIENIHISYISREINQLIRSAEQMVLSSNCSVTTLLEFITNKLAMILNLPLVWVKICKDFEGQILSDAGELREFLYENDTTWSGLHAANSPVIKAVREHQVVRAKTNNALPLEWLKRLNHDEIEDSLFLPFFLAGGETHAAIGLHSHNKNIFDDDFQQVMTDFSSGLRLICQMAEDQYLMRLHRTAIEKTANAIMITDRFSKIEWVNDAFVKQTQFSSIDVIGKRPDILNSNNAEASLIIDEIWKTVKSGKVWSGETLTMRKDGSTIPVYQTVTPLVDDLGNTTHFISVSEDVTERKENELRIAFMATHDELTELPNRNLLNDRLNQAIARAKRHNNKMAVLFIDIDHFKFINDSLGHQIGDELLKTLAIRLTSALRQEDTVARFGGDEFVVVLPNITSLQAVSSLANALLDNIKQPYHIEEHELIITGSIGISIYPDNALNGNDLIQHADSAMYSAKEQGRNNTQFYTTAINEKINRRVVLEKALRKAIELQQFVLYYQPKVDLETNTITGMEALIRWQHPELGLISPVEFIPLAEETGIILEIGNWVMLTACSQMVVWENDFPELKNMSINVSARQFWQADFMAQVTQIFSETGVSIGKIEFELTESIVMDDVELAIAMMKKLKRLGVSLSIDDFGTGYSSLSYLQQFPVDVLKIDRTFVNDLNDEDADSAIIRSIIALAENFNLNVVAEGIEQAYQTEILKRLGCQYGQGYYFSQPISVDEMTTKLVEQYRS